MKAGLASIAAAITIMIVVLLTYNSVMLAVASILGLEGTRVYQEYLRARFTFRGVYGIPVLVDRGSMTALTLSITLASTPLTIYATRRYRELREYEEQLVNLLLILPGMLAASNSAADALTRAARALRPPFSRLIEKAAYAYRVSGDLDRAMSLSLETPDVPPRVRVVARSIVVAAKAGGRIHVVLARLASYLEATRRPKRLAESRLAEYKLIAVLAVLAYAATAGATIALISKASNVKLPMMTVSVDIDVLTGLFYYSLLIIAVGSAIVIARVIYDYTPLASKYLLILIPVGYITFMAASTLI